MSTCQHNYAGCFCITQELELANGAGPLLKEVSEIIERPLDAHEQWELNKMIRSGFVTRQLVSKVKEIEAYRIAKIRRDRYVKVIKKAGIQLTGNEMNKFKQHQDIDDGVHKEWETTGYPAYYRSGLLEDIEAAKKKNKTKKIKKASTKKKAASKKKGSKKH